MQEILNYFPLNSIMKIGITSQSTLCFSIERIVGGSGDCGDVDKAMWERSPVLLDIPVIQIMKKSAIQMCLKKFLWSKHVI